MLHAVISTVATVPRYLQLMYLRTLRGHLTGTDAGCAPVGLEQQCAGFPGGAFVDSVFSKTSKSSCWSFDVVAYTKAYGFIEFYAGKAACSSCMKLAGVPTASLDITYHIARAGKQNYMDILTDAGMGYHGTHYLPNMCSSRFPGGLSWKTFTQDSSWPGIPTFTEFLGTCLSISGQLYFEGRLQVSTTYYMITYIAWPTIFGRSP